MHRAHCRRRRERRAPAHHEAWRPVDARETRAACTSAHSVPAMGAPSATAGAAVHINDDQTDAPTFAHERYETSKAIGPNVTIGRRAPRTAGYQSRKVNRPGLQALKRRAK